MEFRILGSLAVVENGRPLPPAQRKVAEVITTLAAHEGAWVDLAQFLSLLWDVREEGDEKPGALRTHVYMARRYLDDPDGRRLVSKRGFGYQLRINPAAGDTLDVTSFRQWHEEGNIAFRRGDLVTGVNLLGKALSLWTGDQPLQDFPQTMEMQLQVADDLRRERAAAQESWLNGRLALGEHREMLPVLETLQTADPWDERLLAMRMVALYRCGERDKALQMFEKARVSFAADGIEPGEEVTVIRRQIETADRDLLRPGPLGSRAVAKAVPVVPRQLPPDAPDFTGRESVVQELVELVGSPDEASSVSLVTLSGPPGVGKSVLAVHVAHHVQGQFPDGQFYISLEDTDGRPKDPKAVLAEMLRVLGVADAALPKTLDERTALYRSLLAGRRVLVLLDNAVDAAQVEPLLPGTAGCSVIITAQDQLIARAAGYLRRIEPMRTNEAMQLLERIAGSRRVQREAADAENLIRACAGSPLAIRAVGIRLRTRSSWSLRDFAAALFDDRQRLDQLAVRGLSVRAGIERSYRRLPADEAQVLRAMALVGDSDCGTWLVSMALGRDCSEAMAALADRSLIDDQPVGTILQSRYRVHDLLRDYFWERLSEDPEADDALERLVLGSLELVDYASERVPREEDFPAPARLRSSLFADDNARRLIDSNPPAWLEAEWRTMISVAETACRMGRYSDGYGIARRLSAYLYANQHCDEADALWRVIEQAAEEAGHVLLAADARFRAVIGNSANGGTPDHIEVLLGCANTFAQLGELGHQAHALALLAEREHAAGDLAAAQRHAEHGVQLSIELAEDQLEMICRRSLAAVLSCSKRYEEAIRHSQTVVDIAYRTEEPRSVANALLGLTRVLNAAGQYDRAIAEGKTGLTVATKLGHAVVAARICRELGVAYGHRGQHRDSVTMLEGAISAFESAGLSLEVALCQSKLGDAYQQTGDSFRAKKLYEAATGNLTRLGSKRDGFSPCD